MRYLPPLPQKFKGIALGAAAGLAGCCFFAVFGSGGIVHLRQLQRQQVDLESAAYTLALDNQRLRDHLDRLEKDDRYLEALARERLGWIVPGEIVYRTDTRSRRPADGP